MGQAALILALVLSITVALFAVQNAGQVLLRLGFWTVETSVVVVILASAAAGAAAAWLLGLPGRFRERRRARHLGREVEALKAQQRLSPLTPEAEPPPPPSPPPLTR
jgi:uncharacterized integral membrane protein